MEKWNHQGKEKCRKMESLMKREIWENGIINEKKNVGKWNH